MVRKVWFPVVTSHTRSRAEGKNDKDDVLLT